MSGLHRSVDESGVMRWGGLAGFLGGLLFILVFVIVGVFVGADPAAPEGLVARFPDIWSVRIVENGMYLLVLVLWVTHFLALYRALRDRRSAPALFGSVLGIVGLVVLAAGALPHVATAPISDLYHAPGATPQDKATLVLIWQATQGIFDALFVAGLAIVPVGVAALGLAMLGAPAFGRRVGWMSVLLGGVGVAAAAALLAVPESSIGVLGVFALILFHIVVGWRVLRLSRASSEWIDVGSRGGRPVAVSSPTR